MLLNKKVFKIKKNSYTLHDDSFLVSNFLVKPSYISSISALSYHRLITQIPNEVFCMTSKNSSKIKFDNLINFFHTNYFFGFKEERYEDFKILIAEPEKAIIDSFFIVPVSIFDEALENIDAEKMINYLKKMGKGSIIKRVGYLMEERGIMVYDKLKRFINYKYIPLDPLLKRNGRKNKKWKIIINTK